MARIVVTGAHGKTGRAVVADLLAHGHHVVATDAVGKAGHLSELGTPMLVADLTDYGQAAEVVQDADAVVHLANIPAPGMYPPAVTFNRNTAMNFNVFHAAQNAGVGRVVWSSSETTLGLPFDTPPQNAPQYAPVDEAHYPRPTSAYALSKVVSETVAEHVAAWSGVPFVALRFSNILGPADYARLPEYWGDPRARCWNLWGYIDERDVARACELALTADVTGAVPLIIAAADTVMTTPSADLLAAVFPGVPARRALAGHETLLAIDEARRVIGFEPRHSWRDHVAPAPAAGPDAAAGTDT